MNKLVGLCAVGATKVLKNEIKKQGFSLVPSEKENIQGRVIFTSNEEGLYRAPLCLHSCDRLYLVANEYQASDFDSLFEGAYSVCWQDYFVPDTRIVVDKVRCHNSKLNSQSSVQSVVHKAIYQKLCDRWHVQKVQQTGNTATVRVYIDCNNVLLLLDITGDPLNKRGYRTRGGIAPLRETTAFILLQLLFWKRKTPLVDLFCGSGTIPIEAFLYAYNVPCGIARSFALKDLAFYDKEKDAKIRLQEIQKINTEAVFDIRGFDKDPVAIQNAKVNAQNAISMTKKALNAIDRHIDLQEPIFCVGDFKEQSAKKLGLSFGLILSNPPYGERLEDEKEAASLYQDMACLFSSFKDFDVGIITSNEKFPECVKKRPTETKPLKNGKLDTNLYIYNAKKDTTSGNKQKGE